MNTSFPNSIVRAYLGVHETGVRARSLHREPRSIDISPAPNKPVTEDYDGTNHVSQSVLLIAL